MIHSPLRVDADADEEAFVVVAEDLDVVVLWRADAVAHDPVRALLLVGRDVEEVRAVGRPGDARPRRVVQLVVEVVAGWSMSRIRSV